MANSPGFDDAEDAAPFALSVKEIDLFAQQICTRSAFPFEVRSRKYFDAAMQAMILELKTFIYGEQRKISVRMPADWREAVKERFAPKWALKRWPVKYRDIEAELFAAYPGVNATMAVRFGQPYITVRIVEPFQFRLDKR